jgi:hypothetical protein
MSLILHVGGSVPILGLAALGVLVVRGLELLVPTVVHAAAGHVHLGLAGRIHALVILAAVAAALGDLLTKLR